MTEVGTPSICDYLATDKAPKPDPRRRKDSELPDNISSERFDADFVMKVKCKDITLFDVLRRAKSSKAQISGFCHQLALREVCFNEEYVDEKYLSKIWLARAVSDATAEKCGCPLTVLRMRPRPTMPFSSRG